MADLRLTEWLWRVSASRSRPLVGRPSCGAPVILMVRKRGPFRSRRGWGRVPMAYLGGMLRGDGWRKEDVKLSGHGRSWEDRLLRLGRAGKSH